MAPCQLLEKHGTRALKRAKGLSAKELKREQRSLERMLATIAAERKAALKVMRGMRGRGAGSFRSVRHWRV